MSFPGFVTPRKAREIDSICLANRVFQKNQRGNLRSLGTQHDKSEIRLAFWETRKAKVADALESSCLRNSALGQFIYYLNSVS